MVGWYLRSEQHGLDPRYVQYFPDGTFESKHGAVHDNTMEDGVLAQYLLRREYGNEMLEHRIPKNGVEACEHDRTIGRQTCAEVGCCAWVESACWSAVGNGPCASQKHHDPYTTSTTGPMVVSTSRAAGLRTWTRPGKVPTQITTTTAIPLWDPVRMQLWGSDRGEWTALLVIIIMMLSIDYALRRAFGRSFKANIVAVLVSVAIGGLWNLAYWKVHGEKQAIEWLNGYALEWLLSVDNLFVFHLILRTYQTPAEVMPTAIFFGVFGAMTARILLFFVLDQGVWTTVWVRVVMGVLLVYNGVSAAIYDDELEDPTKSSAARFLRWLLGSRLKQYYDLANHRLLVHDGSKLCVTLLVPVIFCIEVTDVVFALDSASAKVALIRKPFIVYSSSIIALLGLRAMFFVIDDLVNTFRMMRFGMYFMLVFIGNELILSPWVVLPPHTLCTVMAFVFVVYITLSMWQAGRKRVFESVDEGQQEAPESTRVKVIGGEGGLAGKDGVLKEFDPDKGEWFVEVGGQRISVKPEHFERIEVLAATCSSCSSQFQDSSFFCIRCGRHRGEEQRLRPGSHVKVLSGAEAAVWSWLPFSLVGGGGEGVLAGQEGVAKEFDVAACEWSVKLSGGVVRLKRESFELLPDLRAGRHVDIVGVKDRGGQKGILREFHRDTAEWKVEVRGVVVGVKPKCMVVTPDPSFTTCSNCGNQLTDDSIFCAMCGRAWVQAAPGPAAAAPLERAMVVPLASATPPGATPTAYVLVPATVPQEVLPPTATTSPSAAPTADVSLPAAAQQDAAPPASTASPGVAPTVDAPPPAAAPQEVASPAAASPLPAASPPKAAAAARESVLEAANSSSGSGSGSEDSALTPQAGIAAADGVGGVVSAGGTKRRSEEEGRKKKEEEEKKRRSQEERRLKEEEEEEKRLKEAEDKRRQEEEEDEKKRLKEAKEKRIKDEEEKPLKDSEETVD